MGLGGGTKPRVLRHGGDHVRLGLGDTSGQVQGVASRRRLIPPVGQIGAIRGIAVQVREALRHGLGDGLVAGPHGQVVVVGHQGLQHGLAVVPGADRRGELPLRVHLIRGQGAGPVEDGLGDLVQGAGALHRGLAGDEAAIGDPVQTGEDLVGLAFAELPVAVRLQGLADQEGLVVREVALMQAALVQQQRSGLFLVHAVIRQRAERLAGVVETLTLVEDLQFQARIGILRAL